MKNKIYALAVIFLLLLLTAGCTENVHLTENGSGASGESKKPEPPISIPPDAELIEVTPTPQAEDAGRLVYLILPTDMVPDFIPALGFTDDLTALMVALRTLNKHLTPDINARAKEQTEKLLKQ